MTSLYRCNCCSTCEDVVIIKPVLKNGFITCPYCGTAEIEEVEKQ